MGAIAAACSWLMVTRYSFELSIRTGEELNIPGRLGADAYRNHIQGPLWDLGFRTSAADDMGLPIGVLVGVLTGFFVVQLLIATWFTARSARGH